MDIKQKENTKKKKRRKRTQTIIKHNFGSFSIKIITQHIFVFHFKKIGDKKLKIEDKRNKEQKRFMTSYLYSGTMILFLLFYIIVNVPVNLAHLDYFYETAA